MARFQYNSAVEGFRDQEYPALQDSVYLDHAGSTLCSKSLVDAFAKEMTSVLYGNPHSGSLPSQHSASKIDEVRVHLLNFFKADPDQYDLVFVANATAGVKMVVEGMRSLPEGYVFAYHQACHTSVVGAREEARQSVCLDNVGVQSWLSGENPFKSATSGTPATLFAYSAQSHMDGRRYPLSWAKQLKENQTQSSSRILTLLDAASFSATSQLDLSHPQFAADFVVLSLYKIFGFPDLGVLIVRRSAESVFNQRKYFGGGTVDMVVCGDEQWHSPKSYSLHERLEDGTLPFHSILAVDIAISTHRRLFGSMDQISSHTAYLYRELCNGLHNLRHANGNSVCHIYSEIPNDEAYVETGPVVSFNIRDSRGLWIGLAEFEKLAILRKMHLRTGGVCSPAGIASALDLQPWEMKRNLSAGIRCGEDNGRFTNKPSGIVRASLGAMSTRSDVSRFLVFMKEFFVEETIKMPSQIGPEVKNVGTTSNLQVKTICVYPIKSCSGYIVPPGVRWEVRPEGLAWDPGGRGASSRLSKARMQKHQRLENAQSWQLSPFPGVPSPPDSDSEQQSQPGKILLSNESPILMICASSVDMLNQTIMKTGGSAVEEAVFRANIVIETSPGQQSWPAYSEDMWRRISIGNHGFKLLGACQRCQMVCVDQTTGERRQEPFVTLAKTRRLNGKVYFGTHMRHDPSEQGEELDALRPTIEVGDVVMVEDKATDTCRER
ncbi:molybdenum cofactor sulfurase [Trichoderma arundinaceum]|uniref:Molybdenum cofactor sulfurase n=1 Tax=Trichoderma arundinaceum TaxID=490622 RepID=A0A395NA27_TRIAR|nr:molybdenum cofactor sulfurase [Trichoderma arundinaceum]